MIISAFISWSSGSIFFVLPWWYCLMFIPSASHVADGEKSPSITACKIMWGQKKWLFCGGSLVSTWLSVSCCICRRCCLCLLWFWWPCTCENTVFVHRQCQWFMSAACSPCATTFHVAATSSPSVILFNLIMLPSLINCIFLAHAEMAACRDVLQLPGNLSHATAAGLHLKWDLDFWGTFVGRCWYSLWSQFTSVSLTKVVSGCLQQCQCLPFSFSRRSLDSHLY